MNRETPKLNEKKAREAILYILQKCGSMSREKLECLLYFTDMDYFEKYEEQFMGFTWIKEYENK